MPHQSSAVGISSKKTWDIWVKCEILGLWCNWGSQFVWGILDIWSIWWIWGVFHIPIPTVSSHESITAMVQFGTVWLYKTQVQICIFWYDGTVKCTMVQGVAACYSLVQNGARWYNDNMSENITSGWYKLVQFGTVKYRVLLYDL